MGSNPPDLKFHKSQKSRRLTIAVWLAVVLLVLLGLSHLNLRVWAFQEHQQALTYLLLLFAVISPLFFAGNLIKNLRHIIFWAAALVILAYGYTVWRADRVGIRDFGGALAPQHNSASLTGKAQFFKSASGNFIYHRTCQWRRSCISVRHWRYRRDVDATRCRPHRHGTRRHDFLPALSNGKWYCWGGTCASFSTHDRRNTHHEHPGIGDRWRTTSIFTWHELLMSTFRVFRKRTNSLLLPITTQALTHINFRFRKDRALKRPRCFSQYVFLDFPCGGFRKLTKHNSLGCLKMRQVISTESNNLIFGHCFNPRL